MELTCYINGREVPPGAVYLREMNFGQSSPGLIQVEYRLVVSLADFVHEMLPYYHEFVQDDAEHGANDDTEEIRAMRLAGWPDLLALLNLNGGESLEFLRRHLAFQFLATTYKDVRPSSDVKYLLNSVTSVAVDAGKISFAGMAISKGKG